MYINVRGSLETTMTAYMRRPAMATGGTIMAPGDKLDPTRDKLGIQGQGLMTNRSQDCSLGLPSGDPSPSGSRPSTATSGGDGSHGDHIGSFSMPPEAVNVLETVVNMNKALEQQIDALRMRLTVESKSHLSEKQKLVQDKEKLINEKEDEINDLKDSLVNREDRISNLVKDGNAKDFQIKQKEREICDLKELVKQTEDYAEQLQKRVGQLRSGKLKPEADDTNKEQSDEIRKLKTELVTMKDKINSMERELVRAKDVVEHQSAKIKGLEAEKGVMSEKFKEELDKASRAMRSEVERMREVMKQQYMEMRNLREQNIEISSDVRDIKDILLKNTVKPEPDLKPARSPEKLDAFKTPRPMQKSPNHGMRVPMTSRTVQKSNSTVRTSMPSMSAMNKAAGLQQKTFGGLPPIPKEESSVGKWVPAGTRQSTLNSRTTRRK